MSEAERVITHNAFINVLSEDHHSTIVKKCLFLQIYKYLLKNNTFL